MCSNITSSINQISSYTTSDNVYLMKNYSFKKYHYHNNNSQWIKNIEKTIVPFKTVIARLHCTSQHDEKSVYYAHKSAVEEMPLTKIVISYKITAF